LQATQKKTEFCPPNQVSAAAMTTASEEKLRLFNRFFSRVGLRTYQHPCIAVTYLVLLLCRHVLLLFLVGSLMMIMFGRNMYLI